MTGDDLGRLVRRSLMVVLAVAIVAVILARRQVERPRAVQEPLPVMSFVPALSLTERSGRAVTEADLKGRIWVASFIYTKCPGPCRAMTDWFSRLQDNLKRGGMEDVRLVSFTIDPEHDTPEVLRTYADAAGADPDRWWFLTGKKEDIWNTSLRGFLLTVTDTPADQVPKEGAYLHSSRFALVDPVLGVRGTYNMELPGEIQRLITDIKRLRAE